MDVWGITVATLRRWYIFLPLMALTVFVTWSVGRGIAPQYEATGAAMLIPGPGPVTEEDWVPNPLGSMESANVVIGIVVTGPEARNIIAGYGLNPDYELSQGSRSALMDVDVRDASAQRAVETGAAVFELVADELEKRQQAAGIPKNARYRLQVLQPPYIEDAVSDGKLRNMAVTGVLGAALSLVIAVFFDDLVGLARRRRKKPDEAASDPAEDAPEEPARDPSDETARNDPHPAGHQARPPAEVSQESGPRQDEVTTRSPATNGSGRRGPKFSPPDARPKSVAGDTVVSPRR